MVSVSLGCRFFDKKLTDILVSETKPNQNETPKKRVTPTSSNQSSNSGGPSAGLRVLLQNAGSFLFDDFTDDREDCLTRSIRIQAALVLLSLAEQTCRLTAQTPAIKKQKMMENTTQIDKGRGRNSDEYSRKMSELLKRYEHRISLIAASRQDASPVLARLLSLVP